MQKTAERHIKAPENISGAVSTPKNAKAKSTEPTWILSTYSTFVPGNNGQYLFIGKSGIRHALGSFLTHSHCMAQPFPLKV